MFKNIYMYLHLLISFYLPIGLSVNSFIYSYTYAHGNLCIRLFSPFTTLRVCTRRYTQKANTIVPFYAALHDGPAAALPHFLRSRSLCPKRLERLVSGEGAGGGRQEGFEWVGGG